MNIIDELLKHISNDNSKIIKEITEIICVNKINNMEELQQYENNKFKINNYILSKGEQVDYCIKAFDSFSDDYLELSFDEYKLKSNYVTMLKSNISIDDKILILIKLFSLTGREMFFPVEACKYVLEGKI